MPAPDEFQVHGVNDFSPEEAGTPVDSAPLGQEVPVTFPVPEMPRTVIDPGPDHTKQSEKARKG
jgi:hypothetical protein